jgi:DNA-binding response OmpR family regulator
VHVSKLRRKIDRGSDKPRRIETIRGKGYRFIPTG